MTAPSQSSHEALRVYLIIDMPIGAYLHYCAQLANGLAGTGRCEVRVVALFDDRNKPGIPDDERALFDPRVGLEVLGPAGGSRVVRYWRFFRNLFRHVREVRRGHRGVVHVHTGTGWPLLDTGVLLLYRLGGIRVVRTVHELTAAERIGVPTSTQLAVGIVQARLAHRVIVHHEAERARLAPLLGEAKMSVIPHGNYLCFRSEPSLSPEARPSPGGPLRLLFMGVKRHKGIEVFLRAMQSLHQEHAPVLATVIGRVNTGDEDLLALIRALPNVRLEAGYIPNAALGQYYRESELVVLPYIKGTTSGAVQLAYAFGRAVIASDLPCFREIVRTGETGFVVPAGDADALTQAIRRAVEQRASLSVMGARALAVACAPEYAWDRIATRTVDLYEQVLGYQSAPSPTAADAPVAAEDQRRVRSERAASSTSTT